MFNVCARDSHRGTPPLEGRRLTIGFQNVSHRTTFVKSFAALGQYATQESLLLQVICSATRFQHASFCFIRVVETQISLFRYDGCRTGRLSRWSPVGFRSEKRKGNCQSGTYDSFDSALFSKRSTQCGRSFVQTRSVAQNSGRDARLGCHIQPCAGNQLTPFGISRMSCIAHCFPSSLQRVNISQVWKTCEMFRLEAYPTLRRLPVEYEHRVEVFSSFADADHYGCQFTCPGNCFT
jgi:hypothetical protein